jgi:hypothetical protein
MAPSRVRVTPLPLRGVAVVAGLDGGARLGGFPQVIGAFRGVGVWVHLLLF